MFFNCNFGVSLCVRIHHTYIFSIPSLYVSRYSVQRRHVCIRVRASMVVVVVFNMLYLYCVISSVQPTNYYTALFNRSHRLLACCVWIRMLHIHATSKHFLFDGMFVIVVVIFAAAAFASFTTLSSIPWKLSTTSMHDLCGTQLHVRMGNWKQ